MVADRGKDITVRNPNQMGMMATHLSATAGAGGDIPPGERYITERAFVVGM